MKLAETIRIIEGKRYRCYDLGCDDPVRAARNREIVANGLFTTYYILVENWLRTTPRSKRLPVWIPQAQLPQVSQKDWQQYGGGQSKLREEYELVVVEELSEAVVRDLTDPSADVV